MILKWKNKMYKIISFLFIHKKVETHTSMNLVEKYMYEFDNRFGFILRNGIDSPEQYEKTKLYYISKNLN